MTNSNTMELFAAASRMATEQLFFDAAQHFMAIVRDYPGHELADDALCNAGLCHFHMNSFDTAIRMFRELIAAYPDATIYNDKSTGEFGRTAAKAHYSIINCYLGLNQTEDARKELAQLDQYTDSHVVTAMGETISYRELAGKAIETFEQFKS